MLEFKKRLSGASLVPVHVLEPPDLVISHRSHTVGSVLTGLKNKLHSGCVSTPCVKYDCLVLLTFVRLHVWPPDLVFIIRLNGLHFGPWDILGSIESAPLQMGTRFFNHFSISMARGLYPESLHICMLRHTLLHNILYPSMR